jgi:hypothetical protein
MKLEFEVKVPVLRSATKQRLAETVNPSVGATVNLKVCKSAIVLYGL